jgi:hypothetical protein
VIDMLHTLLVVADEVIEQAGHFAAMHESAFGT